MHFKWEQPFGSLRAAFGQPIVFLADDSQNGPIWMIPTPLFFILHPVSSTTKLFGSHHSKMGLL
jgi:hypothetical protein